MQAIDRAKRKAQPVEREAVVHDAAIIRAFGLCRAVYAE
jgi:hypothetical protein